MHNLPEKLPYSETLELIAKAQAGSVAARNAAIVGNMRLVARIAETAARAVGRPDLVDDLIMAGSMGMAPGDGLLHAIMHFDPARGARFATFAHPYIREAVNKQLASLSRDLGSYKTREKRITIRNKAKRLATTLARTPTAAEVHATLSADMRRNCSVEAVAIALAPVGRETKEEIGAGSEDETIAKLDEAMRLAELKDAAGYLLNDRQRELLTRRYNGERLNGPDRIAADGAEAALRKWFADDCG